jgi:DNA polymerase
LHRRKLPIIIKDMINQESKKHLKMARNILSFQKDMGISEIPLTPEIEKFLSGASLASPKEQIRPAVKISPPGTSPTAPLFSPAPESAANLPLAEIYQDIEVCVKCSLHQDRKQIVPGCGPAGAKLFIIEDQPTAAEEETGHPFAGESGELFDKMLKAIGLDRSEIYLTSIVKCRPLGDRDPNADEIRACLTYLARQIAAVNPIVICAMGPLAAKVLTGNNQSLFRFRGKFHDFHGTPLLPSFHPHFLLNNNEMKKGSWADLQLIQKKIS